MGFVTMVSRAVGRGASATFVTRMARRYPVVAVALFALRWWRRRSIGANTTVVRIRPGETLTITDRTS
jgi:hypothetical protein